MSPFQRLFPYTDTSDVHVCLHLAFNSKLIYILAFAHIYVGLDVKPAPWHLDDFIDLICIPDYS